MKTRNNTSPKITSMTTSMMYQKTNDRDYSAQKPFPKTFHDDENGNNEKRQSSEKTTTGKTPPNKQPPTSTTTRTDKLKQLKHLYPSTRSTSTTLNERSVATTATTETPHSMLTLEDCCGENDRPMVLPTCIETRPITKKKMRGGEEMARKPMETSSSSPPAVVEETKMVTFLQHGHYVINDDYGQQYQEEEYFDNVGIGYPQQQQAQDDIVNVSYTKKDENSSSLSDKNEITNRDTQSRKGESSVNNDLISASHHHQQQQQQSEQRSFPSAEPTMTHQNSPMQTTKEEEIHTKENEEFMVEFGNRSSEADNSWNNDIDHMLSAFNIDLNQAQTTNHQPQHLKQQQQQDVVEQDYIHQNCEKVTINSLPQYIKKEEEPSCHHLPYHVQFNENYCGGGQDEESPDDESLTSIENEKDKADQVRKHFDDIDKHRNSRVKGRENEKVDVLPTHVTFQTDDYGSEETSIIHDDDEDEGDVQFDNDYSRNNINSANYPSSSDFGANPCEKAEEEEEEADDEWGIGLDDTQNTSSPATPFKTKKTLLVPVDAMLPAIPKARSFAHTNATSDTSMANQNDALSNHKSCPDFAPIASNQSDGFHGEMSDDYESDDENDHANDGEENAEVGPLHHSNNSNDDDYADDDDDNESGDKLEPLHYDEDYDADGDDYVEETYILPTLAPGDYIYNLEEENDNYGTVEIWSSFSATVVPPSFKPLERPTEEELRIKLSSSASEGNQVEEKDSDSDSSDEEIEAYLKSGRNQLTKKTSDGAFSNISSASLAFLLDGNFVDTQGWENDKSVDIDDFHKSDSHILNYKEGSSSLPALLHNSQTTFTSSTSNDNNKVSGARKLLRRASFLGAKPDLNQLRRDNYQPNNVSPSNSNNSQGEKRTEKTPPIKRRASITGFLGNVFQRGPDNNAEQHTAIPARKTLSEILEKRERSRVFVYDKRGSTGRVSKELYNEDIIPMKLRLEAVLKLDQMGTVVVENMMDSRPEYPPIEDEDDDSSEESDNENVEQAQDKTDQNVQARPSLANFQQRRSRVFKQESCPSEITLLRSETHVHESTEETTKYDQEDQDSDQKEPPRGGGMRSCLSLVALPKAASSRGLVGEKRNSLPMNFDDDDDSLDEKAYESNKAFEELVSGHDEIIAEARRTSKVVGRALKKIGVPSPFRRTTEVIPKFGELHHHMRSQMLRNEIKHVEVRQNKSINNMKRRAEFINRFDLGEFKALFQDLSDDESSAFGDELPSNNAPQATEEDNLDGFGVGTEIDFHKDESRAEEAHSNVPQETKEDYDEGVGVDIDINGNKDENSVNKLPSSVSQEFKKDSVERDINRNNDVNKDESSADQLPSNVPGEIKEDNLEGSTADIDIDVNQILAHAADKTSICSDQGSSVNPDVSRQSCQSQKMNAETEENNDFENIDNIPCAISVPLGTPLVTSGPSSPTQGLFNKNIESSNYVQSRCYSDESSDNESNENYKQEDVDLLATYFGLMLGIDRNKSSAGDTSVDTFDCVEDGHDFTAKQMERLDDVAFVANFLYCLPENAVSMDDMFKPTSLCIYSGYKFEFLMSIFSQYKDRVSRTSLDGVNSSTSVASKDSSNEDTNKGNDDMKDNEDYVEETSEHEESNIESSRQVAVPAASELIDLNKLHSVMERLFFGKKIEVEVANVVVEANKIRRHSLRSFASLGSQLSKFSYLSGLDDDFSLDSSSSDSTGKDGDDDDDDDDEDKCSLGIKEEVGTAPNIKTIAESLTSSLGAFGFQRQRSSEQGLGNPSQIKQGVSQQDDSDRDEEQNIPSRHSPGVENDEDNAPPLHVGSGECSSNTREDETNPSDIAASFNGVTKSFPVPSSNNEIKGWWQKPVSRLFVNENIQSRRGNRGNAGLKKSQRIKEDKPITIGRGEVAEFSVSITSVEDRGDINSGPLPVFVIEVTDENDDHTYTIEHSFAEFERLHREIQEQGIKMKVAFPGQGALAHLIGRWAGSAPAQGIASNRKVELNAWLIELTECLAWGTISGQLCDRCVDFLWHSDAEMKHKPTIADEGPKTLIPDSSVRRWRLFAKRESGTNLKKNTVPEVTEPNPIVADFWPSRS